jgi:SAM-dependent methyltransferase
LALALGRVDPDAVLGVPMSAETTGVEQANRLHARGYRVRALPALQDVDMFQDALEVARIAPYGRFAAAVRGIVAGAPHRFALAAGAGAPGARLRFHDGSATDLPVERWLGETDLEENRVLDRAQGPVLDVGCGPGRYAAALLRRGVPALGIDPAPTAIALARRRGAAVLQRSVFDPLPRSGAWATALLLDGNIGIGGDPVRLLGQLRALLRPGGRTLVEVGPPGADIAGLVGRTARLEIRGTSGPWFRWATVGAGAIPRLAFDAGFDLEDVWAAGGRWFAQLRSERSLARAS